MNRWVIGTVAGIVAGGLALAQEATPTKAPSEIKKVEGKPDAPAPVPTPQS